MRRSNKSSRPIFSVAVITAFAFGISDSASPQSYEASVQTTPAISIKAPAARDANTFQMDKTLDAACRDSGQTKAVCLCTIHVMKYEMSLKTYRAATQLYGLTGDRSAAHRKLYAAGYRKADIESAEIMERDLMRSDDFGLRCANAKAYYRQSAR